jgi:hypothetical protein
MEGRYDNRMPTWFLARLKLPTLSWSLWGLGIKEEEGYCTGTPGYIGWQNSFLGIDSRALYTFKNTGSFED